MGDHAVQSGAAVAARRCSSDGWRDPAAPAWTPPTGYQVEWVYRVRYGFEDKWWRLFRTYQIAQPDEQKHRGFVMDYVVERPSLHVSEESRWDYRIVITYRDRDATAHEAGGRTGPLSRRRRPQARRGAAVGIDRQPLGPPHPRRRPPRRRLTAARWR